MMFAFLLVGMGLTNVNNATASMSESLSVSRGGDVAGASLFVCNLQIHFMNVVLFVSCMPRWRKKC